ncbi:hypothetical protein BS47DRAFT_1369167 [Hydnum rufescens UP504]|uniref:Uncharacterized protein n=1 Tax=Hydnum rufescens UP504 TaxID=1448309 RepID=A0A9P6AEM1_9AGAM|nr:hypothetical protein BS47DRAFT_1369167 [Hydnum rufescens UP504]
MLPPELSTSGPASRVPRPGVVTDAPTVIPPRIPGLAAPGGQGSSAGGGGTSSKASVTLKDSLSESEKVAVLLRTLQAERDQFVLGRQHLVEQHGAELRSVKYKVKSSATQKSASLPLSSPIPPLTSPTLPGRSGQSGSGAVGALTEVNPLVLPLEAVAAVTQPCLTVHDPAVEKVIAAVTAASLGQNATPDPKADKTFAFEPSLFVDPVDLQRFDVLPSIVVWTIDRGYFVPLLAMTAEICARYEQDSSIIPSICKLISQEDTSKEAEFVDADKLAVSDLMIDKSHWLQGYEYLLQAMKTQYHLDVIASVQHLRDYLVAHRFFDLQFSVITRCDLSLRKKFFSTMVDFRLYDIETALVEAREAQVDADNAKLIEDHVRTLWTQHAASYLGNRFDPITIDHRCRTSGYGASLTPQQGGPALLDPVSPSKRDFGPMLTFQPRSHVVLWAPGQQGAVSTQHIGSVPFIFPQSHSWSGGTFREVFGLTMQLCSG